ncbi:cation:proton antiporter [Maridesulfovibrio hydrothermalis]|uniref:Sodium/hydrogen exchanger n=1 Tax=Maridesulfovibrio hydrothermalis AM13 = DSM 14728 TaxID=1121451 RepID=L0R6M3_9BACT|nr:cation:proton antiporter [Maridesulfovibrio hydrothermalis]CCO22358.1 Sodium/hydrogen exchanger [Maridesulfovibrio hydrothermalis AM13 = DSM 14728]
MTISALTLITLGLLFIIGFAADSIGRYTPIPRVSVLMVAGFFIGPSGFDLLPVSTQSWMPVVSDMALVMIGFMLGSSLKYESLKLSGMLVLWVTVFVVGITALMVGGGMWLAGIPLPLALLCGGIAPATAPAATVDVVHEVDAKGRFTESLLKIIAIDDALGLIIFSLMLAAAQMMSLGGGSMDTLMMGGKDIGLAVLIGILLGGPMSYLTGYLKSGEHTLLEALGMVCLCGGVAMWLDVSFLLAAMTMGAVVVNFAKYEDCSFHSIKGIEWPVIVLFFLFAGVNIELEHITSNQKLIVLYIVLRIVSRFIGSIIGSRVGGESSVFGKWMGMALMPQAGVALGMALTAAHRVESFREIISIIAATTIFFEIVGPICTRFALKKVGNISLKKKKRATGGGCTY